jgi:hypothetical protein
LGNLNLPDRGTSTAWSSTRGKAGKRPRIESFATRPGRVRMVRTVVCAMLASLCMTPAEARQPRPTGPLHRAEVTRKRSKWFHDQRAYPLKNIPVGARLKALHEMEKMMASEHRVQMRQPAVSGSIPEIPASTGWTLIGPQPLNVGSGLIGGGSPVVSGRVTALAVDPTNPQVVYLGAAQGGVWKTTDGGSTWTPLTDAQASLAVGSIALDPSNPSILYVGTGEENFSGDSYYGAGILKSTDGGATWIHLPGSFAGPTSADSYFGGGARIDSLAVHLMRPPTWGSSPPATAGEIPAHPRALTRSTSRLPWLPAPPR